MSEKEIKKSKTRQELYNMYMQALSEDKLPWTMRWSGGDPMHNPSTGTKYRGINTVLLEIVSYIEHYNDPRWATFNQIADKDNKYHMDQKWHLKKGSKGVHIENWKIYDKINKQRINFNDYNKLIMTDPDFNPANYALSVITTTVFNYSCIEGAPKYEAQKHHTVSIPNLDAFCNEVNENMGVEIHHGGNSAYYVPKEDAIYLPELTAFETADDYYATRLHETAHSTGSVSRLDRDLSGGFGSEQYAREELRAEIASSVIFADLKMPEYAKTLDNHKAYIQSWIQVLKSDPDELFRAFKDAEKISDYILEKGAVTLERIRLEEIDDSAEFLKQNISLDQENINISSEEYRCLMNNVDDLKRDLDEQVQNGNEMSYDLYASLRDELLAEHGFRYMDNNLLDVNLEDYFSVMD